MVHPHVDQIVTFDSRVLVTSIPDESVDLIFTDPPYPSEHLPPYGWLAAVAARLLKPGDFLLTYVGSIGKYNAMLLLGQHLTYFYDYAPMHAGPAMVLWKRKAIARHTSILAFVKGQGVPRCIPLSARTEIGVDKRYHHWGQNESTARYYIDCFSPPGDLVWGPLVGGGTISSVCPHLGRHYIAFELVPAVASQARQRLSMVQAPWPGLVANQCQMPLFEEVQPW
jgi:hypothetical protein